MFDWLKKAVEKVGNLGKKGKEFFNKVVGKVKGGVKTGLKVYEEGKELVKQGKEEYGKAKEQVSALPFIGDMAKEKLGKLEGKAGQLVEKLAEKGLSEKNLEVAAGIGRRIQREL